MPLSADSISTRSVILRLLGGCLIALCFGYAQGTTRALPEFTDLVADNGPTVVNISTKQVQTLSPGYPPLVPESPEESPLEDFFRHFFGEPDDPEFPGDGEQARSLGSGFIISADGYVLTNAHVVEGADEILVRTSDHGELVASLIGTDRRSDIALLKVDAKDLPVARIGSAKDLQVGEWVLAIGSPFGFEHSATAGIVSAKGRSLPSENYVPFIQTDVAINPGNSGGPLFNLDGEVVGVNSQIYSQTGGFMGLSFAIPIDMAMDVADQLKTKGRVSRGWLGVLIQDVTRELAPTFGLSQPRGALVAQVVPGSPAESAGLVAGDVILSYQGKDVPTSGVLPPLVGATSVGETVQLEVLRQTRIRKMEVQIAELPDEDQMAGGAGAEPLPGKVNRLGVVAGELTAEQRERLGIDHGGVLVESIELGPAEAAGITAGDVILMLDNQPVEDLSGFNRIVEGIESGRAVSVLIHRGDGRMFYALRIPTP